MFFSSGTYGLYYGAKRHSISGSPLLETLFSKSRKRVKPLRPLWGLASPSRVKSTLLLSFSVSQLLSFSASQLLSFSASQLLSFSVSQLLSFSASQFLSFSASQLLSFLVSQFLSFSASQLLSLSASQPLSFSASQLLKVPCFSEPPLLRALRCEVLFELLFPSLFYKEGKDFEDVGFGTCLYWDFGLRISDLLFED